MPPLRCSRVGSHDPNHPGRWSGSRVKCPSQQGTSQTVVHRRSLAEQLVDPRGCAERIFEYSEGFYHRERWHTTLGNLSRADYESRHVAVSSAEQTCRSTRGRRSALPVAVTAEHWTASGAYPTSISTTRNSILLPLGPAAKTPAVLWSPSFRSERETTWLKATRRQNSRGSGAWRQEYGPAACDEQPVDPVGWHSCPMRTHERGRPKMPCSGTSCLSLAFPIRSHSVGRNVWRPLKPQLRKAAFHPNTSRCFAVSASFRRCKLTYDPDKTAGAWWSSPGSQKMARPNRSRRPRRSART